MRNFPPTMNVGERLNVCLWFSDLCGSFADFGSGECGWCDAVVSIIEERQPPSSWLLCGSEAALCGWKRLMKSTRESVRVSTSQQCHSSCSPCTCSEAPLLSCSGWRSLNDLQISLIFQGPGPFRVLPRRMMAAVVLAVCLQFLPHCLPKEMTEACKRFNQASRLSCAASNKKQTFVLWWKDQWDPATRTSEKNTPAFHQYCCALCTDSRLGWSAVQTWGKPFVYLLTWGEKEPLQRNTMTQMAAVCEVALTGIGAREGLNHIIFQQFSGWFVNF